MKTKLDEAQTTEIVMAAPGDEGWHFVEEKVSTLFKYVAGDDWHRAVYAPYYKEFWAPILESLENRKTPVQIVMECDYDYGNMPESELHGLMDSWRTNRLTRTKPNMLAVSEREADSEQVTTVHLVVRDFQIKELSDI